MNHSLKDKLKIVFHNLMDEWIVKTEIDKIARQIMLDEVNEKLEENT